MLFYALRRKGTSQRCKDKSARLPADAQMLTEVRYKVWLIMQDRKKKIGTGVVQSHWLVPGESD